MYCPKCGTPLPDNAIYCTACGLDVAQFTSTSKTVRAGRVRPVPEDPFATVAFDAEQYEQAAGYEPPEFDTSDIMDSSGKQEALKSLDVTRPDLPALSQEEVQGQGKGTRSRLPVIIAVVVVVVIALAAGGGYLWWQHDQDVKAHVPQDAVLDLHMDGYTGGSGVPVTIEGVDLDGTTVSRIEVLQPTSSAVSLLRGEYTLRCSGYPVADDGVLFKYPKTELTVHIDADGVRYATPDTAESEHATPLEFTAVAPEDVTDKQVASAEKWQRTQGVAQSAIDARSEAVKSLRSVRLKQIEAQKAAEEKERKAKAAAAAAKKAAKAKADALAANPTSLDVGARGAEVTLTGDIVREYTSHEDSSQQYDTLVYYIVLPQALSINGQSVKQVEVATEHRYAQASGFSTERMSIDGWEEHVDRTVSVSGTLICESTLPFASGSTWGSPASTQPNSSESPESGQPGSAASSGYGSATASGASSAQYGASESTQPSGAGETRVYLANAEVTKQFA